MASGVSRRASPHAYRSPRRFGPMESLTGLAPARTVRETVGLLLSDSDEIATSSRRDVAEKKTGKGLESGGAYSIGELPHQRHLSGSVPAFLPVSLATASSGHAMSCSLGRQRSWPASRAFSRQPAASLTGSPQVRYLRPVIVTVTDSLSARERRRGTGWS